MNQSFYEIRGKEKLRELLKEGQASQAYYRSRPRSPSILCLLHDLLVRYRNWTSLRSNPELRHPDSKSVRPRYGE